MRLQREDLQNKYFYEIGEESPWQTCLWAAEKSEGLSSEGLSPRQTSMRLPRDIHNKFIWETAETRSPQ